MPNGSRLAVLPLLQIYGPTGSRRALIDPRVPYRLDALRGDQSGLLMAISGVVHLLARAHLLAKQEGEHEQEGEQPAGSCLSPVSAARRGHLR